VKVRAGGRVVSVAVVSALGVRATGEREVLGLDVGPTEAGAFWRHCVHGRVACELSGARLVISDAQQGLKDAGATALPGTRWQCGRVHTVRTQSPKRVRRWAATRRAGRSERDDVADLQCLVADDDALHQELQQLLPLLEGHRRQPVAHPGAERPQAAQHVLRVEPLPPEPLPLGLLVQQPAPPLLEQHPALGQLPQLDDRGLVGVEQSLLLPPEPLQARREPPALGLLVLVALRGFLHERLELRHQPARVFQEPAQVLPDGRLQLVRPDRPPSADLPARAQDRVFAAALVVAPLRLPGRRRVVRPEHGQPAAGARQQAAQQVPVPGVVAEGERRVAGELLLRLGERRLVHDGRHRDRDPLLARPELAARRLARARPAARARLRRAHVAVAVGVGRAGVGRVGQDAVDDRLRPWALARARVPRPEVQPLEDLAERQPLVDEPAVEHARDRRLGVVDDQVAGRPVALGHVAVAVGRPAAEVLAGAGLLQLAPSEPLPEQRPLVFGDRALDLQQQLLVGVVADGALQEGDLAAGAAQLLQQQHLVGVLAGQAVGAEDGHRPELPGLGVVPQPVQARPVQARAAVALVRVDVRRVERVAVPIHPGAQRGQLALNGLLASLPLGRDAGVDRDLHHGPPAARAAPACRRPTPAGRGALPATSDTPRAGVAGRRALSP